MGPAAVTLSTRLMFCCWVKMSRLVGRLNECQVCMWWFCGLGRQVESRVDVDGVGGRQAGRQKDEASRIDSASSFGSSSPSTTVANLI